MKGNHQDDHHAEQMSAGLAGGVDRSTADPTAALPFIAVPAPRFVLMNLLTFSLYEIWWFYKNWRRVKERTGSDIRPFWRAIFSPIYCYQFVKTVGATSEKVSVPAALSAGGIALAYLGLLLCEGLPDPWWWLSLCSFVPLVPVVLHIERLHQALYPGFGTYAPFGKGHVMTLAITAPLTALAVLGTLGPPTKALRGAELPASYRETLLELGHLEADEQVLFFYSNGIFSISEDGNLLTDRRVVSYASVDGAVWSEAAPYDAIEAVEVAWSESGFADTMVTVITRDDRIISLLVSAEDELDHTFVDELEARRAAAADQPPEVWRSSTERASE